MKHLIYCVIFFCCISVAHAGNPPSGLTTDLLEHTDRVFLNGYLSTVSLESLKETIEPYQLAAIRSQQPYLGWIVNDDKPNTLQTAYQIQLSTKRELLLGNEADMWDSGKILSDESTAVQYSGKELQPSTVYYWRVRTWSNHGEVSSYSTVKCFMTSEVLTNETSRYPLQKVDENPITIQQKDTLSSYIDFGKDAFGRLRISITAVNDDTLTIHLGEYAENGRLARNPGGTIRYAKYPLAIIKGTHTYTIKIRPDGRNTGSAAIKMPDYIGEVMPFRYCEVESSNCYIPAINSVVREAVYYPFNDEAASFSSSDHVLNEVWKLSKYSIKATSFAGIYVDGDRERIPYEADAYINQLCHYSVDREFSMARCSHEYLIHHATWPTEWIMQSVLMAWNDYLYTGNPASLLRYYTDLKAKTLTSLTDQYGLISTTTGKQTPQFLQSIHFKGEKLRDIVDWPHSGTLGLEKGQGGEDDGYQYRDYNTVVNAYHFEALKNMGYIAKAIGKTEDEQLFAQQAETQLKAVNAHLFSSKTRNYIDGIGTDHSSLHANMFPLVFNMVAAKQVKPVVDFVRSRGMACSVYGSQFLLDAVYNAHEAEYGLSLLTSQGDRSWYNMIREGSTISMEAWGNKFKPNQDWNHAWGAAPANLIPRKLMGVEPLEPGFRKIRIKPQPATLEQAEMILPTIRGNIVMSWMNRQDGKLELTVTIPHNATAEVWLPFKEQDCQLIIDGVKHKAMRVDGFVKINELGSGTHHLEVIGKR